MRIKSDKVVSTHEGWHIGEVVDRIEAQTESSSCLDLIQLAVLPDLQQKAIYKEKRESKQLLCLRI